MKKYFLCASIISLGLASCKKSEVRVEAVEHSDGTVSTTTMERHDSVGFDSAKINETVNKAQEKLDKAEEKIDEFAKDGRTQFKKAGKDVKDAAEKSAEKIDKGVDKLKEDLQKK